MNQNLIINIIVVVSMIVVVAAVVIIIEGSMAYDAGRQSIIKEMQEYGCEKVLGYIIR